MIRVGHVFLVENDQVFLLQKPRRGWFVAPGGKSEFGESVLETAVREFYEETNLCVENPKLRAISTMRVYNEAVGTKAEWLMYTFMATSANGQANERNHEGELYWKPLSEALTLPMAEGDRLLLKELVKHDRLIMATFDYTTEYQLLAADLTIADETGAFTEVVHHEC
ncbi:MAG: NUDIX hydrolase [Culicoidibacterales bacterium]